MQAVLDMSGFDDNYPRPDAPTVKLANGKKFQDTEDKKYKEALSDYAELRFCYMILKSLEATPGLEWDTVDMSKPETWANYQKDLKAAGFNINEINRILQEVFDVNALNDDKLKEAKDRFTRSQALQAESEVQYSQKDELGNTESGELAKD